ncbi:unnamed protein product [Linum trigynum]|uniref:Uncharacterized protein n=1 Tax=Linum trigynum TaxID=586398 RepID=A0AAV2FJM3_9ROSI
MIIILQNTTQIPGWVHKFSHTVGIDETVLREPVCGSIPFSVCVNNVDQPILSHTPPYRYKQADVGVNGVMSILNQLDS